MSDLDLDMIRYKKLLELKKQIEKKKMESEPPKTINPQEILDKVFVDRAWEVFNAAKRQYPEVAQYIERMLINLILKGKIREKISGEDLYGLFLRLGYKVRLQTRINIIEHGRIKSLEEKIKEETSNL
ncbi:MAG: DNA-binding protein [Candidatus Bathyarchaeia archaeon]